MSLVRNKKVVDYFNNKAITPKKECKCSSQAQIKHCQTNCFNQSFHKINYSK